MSKEFKLSDEYCALRDAASENLASELGEELARRAMGDARKLYWGQVNRGKAKLPLDATKLLQTIYSDAVEAYAALAAAGRLDDEGRKSHAEAWYYLAINAGQLGDKTLSREASRRAYVILEPWAAEPPTERVCEIIIYVLRSLAGTAQEDPRGVRIDEVNEYYAKGMRAIGYAKKRGWCKSKVRRYTALFDRTCGASLARVKPATVPRLEKSEMLLRAAVAELSAIDKEERRRGGCERSFTKAQRELARALRQLAIKRWDSSAQVGADRRKALKAIDESARLLKRNQVLAKKRGQVSQWDYFQLAKVLRDRADLLDSASELSIAVGPCLIACRIVEESRARLQVEEDAEKRRTFFSTNLPIFDFGIYLMCREGVPDGAYELAQRCKSRTFSDSINAPLRASAADDLEREAPFNVSHAREALNEREALVEIHAGVRALTLMIVRRDRTSVAFLRLKNWPRERLEEKARRLLFLLSDPHCAKRTAMSEYLLKGLGTALFEPILEHLDGIDRLFVTPSYPLSEIPLGALALSSGEQLIDRWNLSLLPHSSLLPLLRGFRKRKGGSFLAFVPDRRLVHSEMEAEQIAREMGDSRILRGDDASKDQLAAARLKNVAYLHITSHGRFDASARDGAYLVLAGDSPQAQMLTASEIAELDLRGISLASLPCCFTGRGHHLGGDDMVAIPHAMLLAKAKAVLTSLWDIEEDVSRQLVVHFYQRLARERVSMAQALVEAQRWVRQRHPHPYYWGAFQLWGGV